MILKMLVKVFFRSFFIHSFLHDKGMQNVGFCYAISPVVKYLRFDPCKEADFRKRHLHLFSTNPYFATAIIGTAVREELCLNNQEGEAEAITQQKNMFMAPYAALGDPLFSGALRPFCSVVSVCLAFQGFLVAPLVYLALFNPLPILLRFKFFLEGYKKGSAAFQYIQSLHLPVWTGRLRIMTLGVTALLAFVVISSHWDEQAVDALKKAMTYGGGALYILLCYHLIRVGISQMMILYSSAGLVVFVSWILW